MFDWDEENIGHIARHGVTRDEAEQVIANDPLELQRQYWQGEERTLEVGMTNGMRCLNVITTWRGEKLRVVSAFPAAPQMRARYFSRERS